VCCSNAVEQQFTSVGAANSCVIYPGVDNSTYATVDRSSARTLYELPPDAPVIATAGTLSAARGQDLVIRALPSILEDFPGLTYLAAGQPHPYDTGNEEARLSKLAEDLGVRANVRFLGFAPSPEGVFTAADVVVNPARFPEPFGRVAIEALACGRPVVATRVGAIDEVLSHDRTALLVERDDAEGLAQAIGQLLGDEALRMRLVEAGRADVALRFSEPQATARFIRVAEAAAHRE
jgi:mannosyltransferase